MAFEDNDQNSNNQPNSNDESILLSSIHSLLIFLDSSSFWKPSSQEVLTLYSN